MDAVRVCTLQFFFFIFFVATASSALAQVTRVHGTVVDAGSKKIISYASIYFKGQRGVTADSSGHFTLSTTDNVSQLVASAIGYKTYNTKIQQGKDQEINIELAPDVKELNSVTVSSTGKPKGYHNKK